MDFFLRLKKDEGFFTSGGGTGSDPGDGWYISSGGVLDSL